MKETFYFSHDYNTRTDSRIKRIITKHGMLGYGCFWAIIEDLYNNANALRLDYECIAFDLRTNEDIVKSIINDFELFVFDGEVFGSLSVQKRIDERVLRSKKAADSARKRWEMENNNANALPTQSDSNAIKESKPKEIKENENNFDFDFIWKMYGMKGNKKVSLGKLSKLKSKEKELIEAHIPIYIASVKDKQFLKNFETYLNQRHWETEINGVLVTEKKELIEYVTFTSLAFGKEEKSRESFEATCRNMAAGGYVFTEIKSEWR